MKITLKLYATLSEFLPGGAVDNAVRVELPEDSTPNAVFDRYRIPRELTHLVLVNGVYCGAGERDSKPLKQGDTLAVWPPVAGG